MAHRPSAETAVYTALFLSIYDVAVLWLANKLLWKCSTRSTLLPLFTSALGRRHLDMGVGTGYFPSTALKSASCPCEEMTLVDLNPTPLRASRRRVLRSAASSDGRLTTVKTIVADATMPLPLAQDRKFDSISAFYLLHCLSGPPGRKIGVFDVARRHLADDGVFVGATVLPLRNRMSWLAASIMAFYNRAGIFSNERDAEDVFAESLRRNFAAVDVWTVGAVMCWRARGLKADRSGVRA
ncbi:Methyltransferase type 11 [Metarhizium album ARSEF 1941]|uniref:Methyltransferase type 11 n=1 Tax=Metarhizium album (strain ARSEF 1941) TaxID=1081103 RepID=A0A0B2WN77_METAS|nr:Methyltransferase type 11 [Metarhizium album ARSEF 1941]KHN97516.1 Methyltransferase type 11 [Metarhizium album ARSEF 1941]